MEDTIPNTNRQFTTDNEYTGIANSQNNKPRSYQDIYNATIRSVTNDRQVIASGRTPASQGPKNALDSSDLNVSINRPQIDSHNKRSPAMSNIIQEIRTKDPCSITTQKNTLDNDAKLERTNPEILKTFKQNPFTHSLVVTNSHKLIK